MQESEQRMGRLCRSIQSNVEAMNVQMSDLKQSLTAKGVALEAKEADIEARSLSSSQDVLDGDCDLELSIVNVQIASASHKHTHSSSESFRVGTDIIRFETDTVWTRTVDYAESTLQTKQCPFADLHAQLALANIGDTQRVFAERLEAIAGQSVVDEYAVRGRKECLYQNQTSKDGSYFNSTKAARKGTDAKRIGWSNNDFLIEAVIREIAQHFASTEGWIDKKMMRIGELMQMRNEQNGESQTKHNAESD